MPWVRTALKVAPVALEVARQLDRQLRPHVLAYQLARDVDGYVGRWTGEQGTHWVVVPERDAAPLRAFPPLTGTELDVVDEQLDRNGVKHHAALPEARVRETGVKVAAAPGKLTKAVRRRG